MAKILKFALGGAACWLIFIISAGSPLLVNCQTDYERELYVKLDNEKLTLEEVVEILEAVSYENKVTIDGVSVARLLSLRDTLCELKRLNANLLRFSTTNQGLKIFLEYYKPLILESCHDKIVGIFETHFKRRDKETAQSFYDKMQEFAGGDRMKYEKEVWRLGQELSFFKNWKQSKRFWSCSALTRTLAEQMPDHYRILASFYLKDKSIEPWSNVIRNCQLYLTSRCLKLKPGNFNRLAPREPFQQKEIVDEIMQCNNYYASEWYSNIKDRRLELSS